MQWTRWRKDKQGREWKKWTFEFCWIPLTPFHQRELRSTSMNPTGHWKTHGSLGSSKQCSHRAVSLQMSARGMSWCRWIQLWTGIFVWQACWMALARHSTFVKVHVLHEMSHESIYRLPFGRRVVRMATIWKCLDFCFNNWTSTEAWGMKGSCTSVVAMLKSRFCLRQNFFYKHIPQKIRTLIQVARYLLHHDTPCFSAFPGPSGANERCDSDALEPQIQRMSGAMIWQHFSLLWANKDPVALLTGRACMVSTKGLWPLHHMMKDSS